MAMETARRRSSAPLLLLLVLLAAGRDGPRRASALSVTVQEEECVYEYVLFEGDTVSGNFVVVDHDIFWTSDHPGIDFVVTSPGGNTVHSLKGTSGDKFEFKAPRAGMYKFCFHNPSSTPEAVSFYVHVGHIPNEHDLAKDEHLDPVNVKIAQLREALESVTAEQRYLKARDVRHRHTMQDPAPTFSPPFLTFVRTVITAVHCVSRAHPQVCTCTCMHRCMHIYTCTYRHLENLRK